MRRDARATCAALSLRVAGVLVSGGAGAFSTGFEA
jgi:hypothetical protein